MGFSNSQGRVSLLDLLILAALFLSTLSSAQTTLNSFNTTVSSGLSANYDFGYSVASFGNLMVVGVRQDQVSKGSAVLFNCTSFPCTQAFKMVANDAADSDSFGNSVSISGNMVVVGCSRDDNDNGNNAGSVYIYNTTGCNSATGSCTQMIKVTEPSGSGGNLFGFAVAISGNIVAISNNVGSVYVYSCSLTGCSSGNKLTGVSGSFFGSSIAIDGSLLVVGANKTNSNQGTAYVYNCTTLPCTLGATLNASDPTNSAYYGSSVAVRGNMVVVGAMGLSSNKGAAYVLQCTTASSCTTKAKLTASDGATNDNFGSSVAISNSVVSVGAYLDDVGSVTDAGSVYLFDCLNFTCTYLLNMTASPPVASSFLGNTVTMLGYRVAAGANFDIFNNVRSGSVRLFDPTSAICKCNPTGSEGCDESRQCICKSNWTGLRCDAYMGCINCHSNATCANIEGSFSCTCKPGFTGNGTNCADINECAQGTHNCSAEAICSNYIGSFSCSCTDGNFGSGYVCSACGCGIGSTGGTCNASGVCTCRSGFEGSKCDQCQAGRFGSTCALCPSCQNGTCLDGVSGNGSCLCASGFAWGNTFVCDACESNHFGPSCRECPNCNAGTCKSGISGDGTCTCPVGYQNNGSDYCSICETNYVRVGEICAACHPTCATCSGTSFSNCLSCVSNLHYSAANHTCTSNCDVGKYADNGNCVDCDASCFECSGSGAASCTSCHSTQVFDGGFCRSSCQTPATFNNSGICVSCPNRCSSCTSDASGGCTACSNGVLDDGNCLQKCSKSSSYVIDGVCYDCNSTCATCSGPSGSECLSCSFPRALSGTICIEACLPRQYADQSQKCQDCFATCSSCNGSGYSQCTSCNSSSPYKFLDDGVCLPSCGNFKYAPAGEYGCLACPSTCQTCTGPASNACTSCRSGLIFQQGECLSSCSSHYYLGPSSTCLACHASCKTCTSSSSSDCISCTPPSKLSAGSCVEECPVTTIYNQSSNTCVGCTPPCLACSGQANFCLVCLDPNLSILNGSCLASCPEGMVSVNKQCEAIKTCPEETSNSTVWHSANEGQDGQGICQEGYSVFNGSVPVSLNPIRRCILSQDGLSAHWAEITVPCEAKCDLVGCQNGGTCGEDSACQCTAGFEGKYCEQSEAVSCSWRYIGSSCQVDLAPIIIIAASLGGVLILFLILRRFYPLAENTVVLSLALTLYDFITDCLFVYSQSSNQENRGLFYSSLAFVVVPVIFNLSVVSYIFFSAILKEVEVEKWLLAHYPTAAAVAVLASTNVEVFSLLQSKLFYQSRFSAPFKKETVHFLMLCGLFGNVLEDIPQLVIQLIAGSNSLNTVVVLSVVASFLTITFGIAKRAILFLILRFGSAAREKRMSRPSEGSFAMSENTSRLEMLESAGH